MKTRLIIFGIAVYMLFGAPIVNAADNPCGECKEMIQQAEQLWMASKFDESDKLLDESMKKCPKCSDAYWRKSRNIYDRIESMPRDKKPTKDELVKSYIEMADLSKKGYEVDENCAPCYLFYGAGLGRRGTTQGVLRSLFLGEDVEQAWLKSIELKPTYRSADGANNTLSDTYYALGMFYRVVPEWLCYFPLKQLVGTCGNKEKSIECQRKAVEIEPGRVEYRKELGISLICHGQKYDKPDEIEEGKKILKDTQTMPEVKPYDYIDKQHALMILNDPSLACGYQRDRQQELDKEAYEKQQKEEEKNKGE